jgi:hypothetical protein
MKSRHYEKPDSFQPGPGAYRLSDSIGPGNSPAYTMRPKPVAKNAGEQAPGPGAYRIESTVGKAPKISMTARRNLKAGSEAVPGPGAYSQTGYIGRDGSAFTMRPKTSVPSDNMNSPGPGAYSHYSSVGRGLAATMASRTSTNIVSITPLDAGSRKECGHH